MPALGIDQLESRLREVGLTLGEDDDTAETQDTALDPETLPEVEDTSEESDAETQEDDEDISEEEGDEPEATLPDRWTAPKLAEAIGWDVGDLYRDLLVPVSNGEPIPLGQLKDERDQVAAQRAEIEQQRQQLTQAAQHFEQQRQQWLSQSQSQSQEVAEAAGQLERVKAAFEAEDWERMRKEDPSGYAAAQIEYGKAYAAAKAQYESAAQRDQAARMQAYQQARQQHDQAFLQMVPEWQDRSRATEESQKVQQYLAYRGFQPEEIGSIYDARVRVVALDAMRWAEHQARNEQAKGKLRAAPKRVLSPGRGGAPGAASAKNVTRLVEKARKSRNREDKLDAAMAVLDTGFSPQRRKR